MPKIVLFLLGQKGCEVLRAIVELGEKDIVLLVVIGTDKNVRKDFCNEIRHFCINYHINYCLRNDISAIMKNVDGSIALAAGWRWLIKYEFDQIIVFHDSLLPKYRGFSPLVTALLNRDSELGVTAIIANNKFDCGDIVERKSIIINYPVTIQVAISKVSSLYFELAQSIIKKLRINGYLVGVPQDETIATYSLWRDDEDYRINWSSTADSIFHFINCLSYPYKGASTIYEGSVIRVLEAEVVQDFQIESRDVGKVFFVYEDKPIVICKIGLLRIDNAVDEAGKSVLPFKKFRIRLK